MLAAGPFYLGSHAILIDHGPLGIVRYGEVAPDDHVEMGDQVKAGQIIGKIGRLVGIHVHPMLHLEWYDAKARSLSIAKFTCKDRPLYFRSEYLKDSTDLLDSLLCFRKGQICSAN